MSVLSLKKISTGKKSPSVRGSIQRIPVISTITNVQKNNMVLSWLSYGGIVSP